MLVLKYIPLMMLKMPANWWYNTVPFMLLVGTAVNNG